MQTKNYILSLASRFEIAGANGTEILTPKDGFDFPYRIRWKLKDKKHPEFGTSGVILEQSFSDRPRTVKPKWFKKGEFAKPDEAYVRIIELWNKSCDIPGIGRTKLNV